MSELKNKLERFGFLAGQAAKTTNETAQLCVGAGRIACEILSIEHSEKGEEFKRADTIRLLGETLVNRKIIGSFRPQEMIACYWVAFLDNGQPDGTIPADWFRGSISVTSLRVVAKALKRKSSQTQPDKWAWKVGCGKVARDVLSGLREGKLSLRDAKKLIDQALPAEAPKASAAEAEEAEVEPTPKDDDASIEKLTALLRKFTDMAFGKMNWKQDDVKGFLLTKHVIPEDGPTSPEGLAASLGRGDGTRLVKALQERAEAKEAVAARLLVELANGIKAVGEAAERKKAEKLKVAG